MPDSSFEKLISGFINAARVRGYNVPPAVPEQELHRYMLRYQDRLGVPCPNGLITIWRQANGWHVNGMHVFGTRDATPEQPWRQSAIIASQTLTTLFFAPDLARRFVIFGTRGEKLFLGEKRHHEFALFGEAWSDELSAYEAKRSFEDLISDAIRETME